MTIDSATRSRLVGLFVAEAEETLTTLTALAEKLRVQAAPEDLSDFGRSAHGLKGAAAALGFDVLATVLHDLEELSLQLAEAAPDSHRERHARLAQSLELLGQGIAHMAASGRDAFPENLLPALQSLLPHRPAAPRAAVGLSAQPPTAPANGASAPPAAPQSGANPKSPRAEFASPASAPATQAAAGEGVVERISVPAEEVDAALRLASALARGVALFQEHLAGGTANALEKPRTAATSTATLTSTAQALAGMAEQLENSISSLRLLPADSAFSGFEQEVAQLAARLGKQASVALYGLDVRADRRTLQAARTMIRHLVRNALDHGIESPEGRTAANKQIEGHLAIRLETAESSLKVTIDDDGRGFDLPSIRMELSRRSGDPARINTLSDPEVLQLFAFQGGSTRENVSEISGRGVGLSAVAAMARDAGGSIQLATRPGAGSTVIFTLPLEVYAAEVLTFSCSGRLLGLPIQTVERTMYLRAGQEGVQRGPTGYTVAVDESIVPFHRLTETFGDEPGEALERFALVLRTADGIAAFGVDHVGEVIGVVPLSVPGVAFPGGLVSGLAQVADGTVLEILNARQLLAVARAARPQLAEAAASAASFAARAPAPARVNKALEVMLAEDSLATREVLRVLLEEQGFRVRLAADGEEALARVAEQLPDVLVSDVNMPRRDGLSLTRQLRAKPETARLPIILLTSQDDAAAQAAGAAAGADAYLIKSRFNAGVLQETLNRIGVRVQR
jgi:chemotaxis protein histidine kinase CheA